MEDKRTQKEKINVKPVSPKPKKVEEQKEVNWDEERDYGGFPDDVDLKKNLGCGG